MHTTYGRQRSMSGGGLLTATGFAASADIDIAVSTTAHSHSLLITPSHLVLGTAYDVKTVSAVRESCDASVQRGKPRRKGAEAG